MVESRSGQGHRRDEPGLGIRRVSRGLPFPEELRGEGGRKAVRGPILFPTEVWEPGVVGVRQDGIPGEGWP